MKCLGKHEHPSKSEADYCNWLLARKQHGEIKDYGYIISIDLHVGKKVWKKWAIDFWAEELDGEITYHESKGWNRSDDRFRMKLHHFLLEYPERKIYVNKKLMKFTPKGRIIVRESKRKKGRLVKWGRKKKKKEKKSLGMN